MPPIVFLAPAQAELYDAVAFYNDQSEGLGYDFALEVKKTLERILQYPEAWHQLSKRARRCRTNRFPYGIIYQYKQDMVLVVAVMHLSRNPESWKNRRKHLLEMDTLLDIDGKTLPEAAALIRDDREK